MTEIQHKAGPYHDEFWQIECGVCGTGDIQRLVCQGPVSRLARTAPHSCDVPGCPGPENKRKLEAFEDLLAALQMLAQTPHILYYLKTNDPMALEQACAAIAKASPQAQ